ncbi:MAG TPA: energy transducer TonB [Flavobacterium sp.]|nr:energy transducer TonB [Flavobacterium sp.]HPJ11378.1 energy transducer TonB [Flavobacterium sp.]
MKPIQPLFLLLLVPFFSFSQIQGEDEVYLGGDRIEPQFNGGGIEQFGEFVNTHFNYSKVSKPGKMVAAFTIDTDGSVQKIKMIQMIDSESAIEMIRVLNECPKWKPASRGGKPISVEIKYPMVFRPKSKPEKKESKAGEVPVQLKVSEPIDNRTYKEDNIEVAPQFPGGRQEFLNYISTNFKLPEARNISGKVVVSFVVEKDGSITDVKIVSNPGQGAAEEAKRVLLASPKWSPGMQKGKTVRVMYTIPINIASKK